MMKLPNPMRWWRGLPQKTRIRLIAGLLLIFLGTEAFMLAPWAFDVATLIDLLGLGFFEVFLLAPILLYYSQAIVFLKKHWGIAGTQLSNVVSLIRSAISTDRHVALFYIHRLERKGLEIAVWTATVASCTIFIVRAAKYLSEFIGC